MNYEHGQRVTFYPMTRLCDDVPRSVGAVVVRDAGRMVVILKDGATVPCTVSRDSIRQQAGLEL